MARDDERQLRASQERTGMVGAPGLVDGLRARTPPAPGAYRARAVEIADHRYSDPRTTSVPR